ncbi:MAG: membrane protein [Flavobacteriales bacterium]|jgi:membrane protein
MTIKESWKTRWMTLPVIKPLIALSKSVHPYGFEGLSLFYVLQFFIKGLQEGDINTRASAVAFKLLLAFMPFAIMLFTLIPYLPIDNLEQRIITLASEGMPASVFELFEGTLTELISRKYTTFLSLSFLLGIYYASNTINALFDGFSASFHLTRKRNIWKQRAYSIILILTLPIFLATAFAVLTFSNVFFDFLSENEWLSGDFSFGLLYLLKWIVVLLSLTIAITTLYNVGNTERYKWRVITAGGSFATVMLIVVSQGFAFYVSNFGQFNKLYGSLGAILVTLIWVQLISLIILLGFELNAGISKARKTITSKSYDALN